MEAVKESISRRLPMIFEHHGNDVLRDLPQSNLTWAVKAELGQWVRRGIARHYLNSTRLVSSDHFTKCRLTGFRTITGGAVANNPGISALTAEEFYHVRDILESFQDLSMLADVLRHATNCDDGNVLASVADTINCHLDSFSVIGATTDLFRKLLEAYMRLKRLGTTSLDLLFSLIELGFQIPSEFNTVILLRQDFSRLENKPAIAVSSPVSDHIPEISSETDPSLYAKVEQILSSGGGIDEPTWDTTFNVLIRALESGPDQTKLSENDAARYLAQLRRFYPKRFDGMLIRWVCGALKSSPWPTLLKTLPSLIGVGCVSIQAFIVLVDKLSRSDNERMSPNKNMLKVGLIGLLAAPNPEQGRYFDLVCFKYIPSMRSHSNT